MKLLKTIARGTWDFFKVMAISALAVWAFAFADVQIVGVTNASSDITAGHHGQSHNLGSDHYGLITSQIPIWDLDEINVTVDGKPEWVATQVSYPKILRLVGIYGCLDIGGVDPQNIDREIVNGVCRTAYSN